MSYVPAWKDSHGNRFIVLAENHVFESVDDLLAWKVRNMLNYIPYGWVSDVWIELDLHGGTGDLAHVEVKGPHGSRLAVIGGPVFEEANTLQPQAAGEVA